MTAGGTLANRAATGVAVLAAGLLALAYPYTANLVHPFALPALLVGACAAALSLRRIEIGVATAIVLAAMNPALLGQGAWLPGVAWTLMLAGVVAMRQGRDDANPRMPPLSALVLLTFAITLVSFARAPESSDAIPIMRSTVTGVVLLFVIATQLRTRLEIAWAVHGLLVGALLVGGTATIQWLTGAGREIGFLTETGELVYRVSGGLGHPNQLGGFLIVLVPFAIATFMISPRSRPFALLVILLAALGTYASFSRGSLVALAVGCVLMLRPRTIVLALPFVILAALTLAPDTLQERFDTASSSGSELATRTDIWDTALAVWEDDPLVGAGLGSFPLAYAESRAPGKDFLPNTLFQPPPHAHNVYLHLLAEQGLLGLSSFLILLVAGIVHALQLRRSPRPWVSWFGRAMLGAMAAFAVHNLLDVTLLEQTGVYIWVLFGILSAVIATERTLLADATSETTQVAA